MQAYMHNKRSSEIMWTFLNVLLITRLYDSPSSVNKLNAWCAGVCVRAHTHVYCFALVYKWTLTGLRHQDSVSVPAGGWGWGRGGWAVLCYGAKVGGCRWNIITLNIWRCMFNGGGLVNSGVCALFQTGCTFSLTLSGWSAARITNWITLIKLLVILWMLNGAIKYNPSFKKTHIDFLLN